MYLLLQVVQVKNAFVDGITTFLMCVCTDRRWWYFINPDFFSGIFLTLPHTNHNTHTLEKLTIILTLWPFKRFP
jgi:hypothetical protein